MRAHRHRVARVAAPSPPRARDAASSRARMSARDERVLTTVFLAVGVGALFPWNVFITERPYFARRFASTSVVDNFEGAFAFAYSASTPGRRRVREDGGECGEVGESRAIDRRWRRRALAIWTCALVTRATSWSAEEVYGQTMTVIVVVGAHGAGAERRVRGGESVTAEEVSRWARRCRDRRDGVTRLSRR